MPAYRLFIELKSRLNFVFDRRMEWNRRVCKSVVLVFLVIDGMCVCYPQDNESSSLAFLSHRLATSGIPIIDDTMLEGL